MATNVFYETGDNLDGTTFQLIHKGLSVNTSYVVSGYELSSDGGGLDIDVKLGKAIVNGFLIDQTTDQDAQSLTASQTNSVFLNPDGTLTINTTGVPPSNALLLGTAITNGSSVTSVSHRKDISGGSYVVVRKPLDKDLSSTAVLENDNHLLFSAAVREFWEVDLMLIVDQDGATANFKCRFTIPSGTITSFAMGPDDDDSSNATTGSGDAGTATYNHTASVNGPTHTVAHLTLGSSGIVQVKAVIWIGAAAGNIQFQWAQSASNASTTSVLEGSVLIARRILG